MQVGAAAPPGQRGSGTDTDTRPDIGAGSGRPSADHSTEATHTPVDGADPIGEVSDVGELAELGRRASAPTPGRRPPSSPASLIGASDLATRAHQPGSA
jgi:hypothetical protein